MDVNIFYILSVPYISTCFRKRYTERLLLQDNSRHGKKSKVIYCSFIKNILPENSTQLFGVDSSVAISVPDISTFNDSKIVLLCLIIQWKSDKKIVNGASKGSYFLKFILAECKVGNISYRKFRKRLEIQQTAPCTQ
jgi:hypothetical protein